jgi:hypothetical protein
MNRTADRYFDCAEVAYNQAQRAATPERKAECLAHAERMMDLAMAELEKGARGRALRALKAVSL